MIYVHHTQKLSKSNNLVIILRLTSITYKHTKLLTFFYGHTLCTHKKKTLPFPTYACATHACQTQTTIPCIPSNSVETYITIANSGPLTRKRQKKKNHKLIITQCRLLCRRRRSYCGLSLPKYHKEKNNMHTTYLADLRYNPYNDLWYTWTLRSQIFIFTYTQKPKPFMFFDNNTQRRVSCGFGDYFDRWELFKTIINLFLV